MCAFFAEHSKGHIFIEAPESQDVREAVAGIISFQSGATGRKTPLIPIMDRKSLLRVPKASTALERGAWVRPKRGIYKGDLARVFRVDENDSKVWVQLIPRINYEAISDTTVTKRKRPQRCAARFYSRADIM
jgi:transcription elongation factor SPT5